MKRKTAIIIAFIFILVLATFFFIAYKYDRFVKEQNSYNINETFTIANWNMQIFGDKKANDTGLMNFYASTISHFDIVFVQEIRDTNSDGFQKLCSRLPEYQCNISSRAGRSTSKEQYGIIYLKKFSLINLKDFNPDSEDRWERPPIAATFSLNKYSFTVYNIHIKPNETIKELHNLESAVINSGNVIVLGDMNADCNYYDPTSDTAFDSWLWVIKDSDDTTVARTSCAYDRIFMNDDAWNEEVDYGIYRDRINEKISDHYLVWTRMRMVEYERDASLKAFLNQ
jgi:hypothetical protein